MIKLCVRHTCMFFISGLNSFILFSDRYPTHNDSGNIIVLCPHLHGCLLVCHQAFWVLQEDWHS